MPYLAGDFGFIGDVQEREILSTFYQIVTDLDLWAELPNIPETSWQFWCSKPVQEICRHQKVGASGGLVAIAIKHMRFIAQDGWDSYVVLRTGENQNI